MHFATFQNLSVPPRSSLEGDQYWIYPETESQNARMLSAERSHFQANVEILNVWIALTPGENGIEKDLFLMMDKSSLDGTDGKNPRVKFMNNVSTARFPTVGILNPEGEANQNHKWYVRENMAVGEAYVFQTRECPHTAEATIVSPDQQDKDSTGSPVKYRKSAESRVLVLKLLDDSELAEESAEDNLPVRG